jgi:hypothetical protein
VAVKPFNEFEVARAAAIKAARSAIRLKHSIAADEELARRLPEIEAEIDVALLTGEPFVLDTTAESGIVLFDDVVIR